MSDLIRTYSELISLPTFEERFNYCLLDGVVGEETFGWDRYLNQKFYTSPEWRDIRDKIIVRDNGCDLADKMFAISGRIIVHHINPLTPDSIKNIADTLLNPENLICVSHDTHNAITYGDKKYLMRLAGPTVRRPNDTCPWRK